MKKYALFVFNGDPMCFIHVMLNGLDMNEKGYEVQIVIEGAAVKLVPELTKPGNPLHQLWERTCEAGLVAGVCRACSNKLAAQAAAIAQGLPLLDDMSGHPSMAAYQNTGFEVITF